ncbi:MAG: hypothetical protein ABIP30_15745 [Ferruginibacter sp.]
MKKQILILAAGVLMLYACNSDKKTGDAGSGKSANGLTVNDNEDGKTGNFTFDGKDYKGKITTQYFGDKTTGQFSVLCQQEFENYDFVLFQIVFHNEAEASGNSTFKPDAAIITIPAGIVNVTVSGSTKMVGDKQYHTTSDSGGSISVAGKIITIKDIKLVNSDNKEKMLSCEISF